MYTKENIVSVIFSDKDRANLTIKYRNGSTDQIIPFAIEYNPESNQIKELESWGWTYDRIVDNLAEERLSYQRVINKMVDERVNIKLKEVMSKMKRSNQSYLAKLKLERDKELEKIAKLKNQEIEKLSKSKNEEVEKIAKLKNQEVEKIAKLKSKELDKIKELKNQEVKKLSLQQQTSLKKLNQTRLQEVKKLKKEQEETQKRVKGKEAEIKRMSEEKTDILEQLSEVKKEQQSFFENWVNDTLLMNTESEALFKFKLAFFDIDQIKKADSSFKRRLRKAKSVIECFSILNEIYVEPTKS